MKSFSPRRPGGDCGGFPNWMAGYLDFNDLTNCRSFYFHFQLDVAQRIMISYLQPTKRHLTHTRAPTNPKHAVGKCEPATDLKFPLRSSQPWGPFLWCGFGGFQKEYGRTRYIHIIPLYIAAIPTLTVPYNNRYFLSDPIYHHESITHRKMYATSTDNKTSVP